MAILLGCFWHYSVGILVCFGSLLSNHITFSVTDSYWFCADSYFADMSYCCLFVECMCEHLLLLLSTKEKDKDKTKTYSPKNT